MTNQADEVRGSPLKGTLGLRHPFARYIVSGVGTTVLDYGLLYLLLRLRIQRDLSVSTAFGVSLTPVIVMTGFLITRHFVFAPDPLRRIEDHAAGI